MARTSRPAAPAPPAALWRWLAAAPDAPSVPVRSAVTGRIAAHVPVSTPADAVRATAAAAAATAASANRRQWRPGRRFVTSAVPAVALRHAGLGPADAAEELADADRFTARCLRHARRHLPPPWTVPAVVTSYADPVRPLTSLLEGALPALLAGVAVTTLVDVRTAPVAVHAAQALRAAGLADGAWQLLAVRPGDAAGVHAALAEHAVRRAPQCCPPPHRGRAPGLLALRHDGDPRAAARAVLAGLTTRAGRTCAATPVVAVHATRWAEFRAELAPATLRTSEGLDRVQPADAPAGPVAAPFTAWAEVLQLARGTGAHPAVFTRARQARLAPQFDALPVTRLVLNDRPRPGLAPREAFRELAGASPAGR